RTGVAMATRQFLLPDLGEELAEGEIVRWLVAVGDTVDEDQPVAEIETAKAVVEVPSPPAQRPAGHRARRGPAAARRPPGFAAAADRGLLVPLINNYGSLGVDGCASWPTAWRAPPRSWSCSRDVAAKCGRQRSESTTTADAER
ncbi:MAG TPA: biotin/lipoyl-containing protein, partial [Egibacteraceae bacterium]|nr:biotin/lipoyl-containing protein [Egibacteraceae bacterium]